MLLLLIVDGNVGLVKVGSVFIGFFKFSFPSGMTVFCFYLFDRSGQCLCRREWHRTRKVKDHAEQQKLMFGMLFALKNFCQKLSTDE